MPLQVVTGRHGLGLLAAISRKLPDAAAAGSGQTANLAGNTPVRQGVTPLHALGGTLCMIAMSKHWREMPDP